MEDEGDHVYGFTVTLGQKRCEQFQILIDGSDAKVLHPNGYEAPKGTQVHGPSRQEEVERNSVWLIDGRAEPARALPGIEEGEGRALIGSSSVPPAPYGSEDSGQPGDRYRVRLHIAGKWRTVTWSKVQQLAVGDAPA